MIKFLKCASLCEKENADSNLERFIVNLNENFGERSCVCHPNDEWHIAVDLLKNCTYDFHTTGKGNPKNPLCQFWSNLYEHEISKMPSNL